MEIRFNISPKLVERGVLALESIAGSLRLLCPSPLTNEDIPERERKPLPSPSSEDDISIYGDQEAAQDYDEMEDDGGGESVTTALAFMEADPMMIEAEEGEEQDDRP